MIFGNVFIDDYAFFCVIRNTWVSVAIYVLFRVSSDYIDVVSYSMFLDFLTSIKDRR